MIHSLRMEIFLNPQVRIPFYIQEYHDKVLKQKVSKIPRYDFGCYYIKKFSSKDSRKAFIDLLDEAIRQQNWMKPIETQEMKEQREMQKHNVTSGGGIGLGGIKRNMEMRQQKD